MSEKFDKPYTSLGNHLKYLRQQQAESLAEVSGAVEIDEQALERIEAGHERPAEEILMLLINHFNMQDQEAVQLWELAGYDGQSNERQEEMMQEVLQGQKPVIFLVGIDSRVVYTDHVRATADSSGVKLQFGQINAKKQAQPIARLGMSREQAQAVIKELQLALLKADHDAQPRQLPPPQA